MNTLTRGEVALRYFPSMWRIKIGRTKNKSISKKVKIDQKQLDGGIN